MLTCQQHALASDWQMSLVKIDDQIETLPEDLVDAAQMIAAQQRLQET